jgi:type I restriction enzyme R subunit
MTPTELSEVKLVEIPAQKVFEELGYEILLGPSIHPGTPSSERDSLSEVLLKVRLRTKLAQLNPDLPENVYDIAIKQLEGLSEPTLLENNRQFYQMLLAGIKVPYQEQGKTRYYALKLIDFDDPSKNEFLAVRQFWVRQYQLKIIDQVVFINGIPLILFEYKDPTNKAATILDAYHQLSVNCYQSYIPKIFYYNAFLVISDRTLAKYGTMTANYERFSDWNDIYNPDRNVSNRLELMQRSLFEKSTLLDIIRNYLEFENDGRRIIKKIAQQHQYLAVAKAVKETIRVFPQKDENRIGVVWHTTGSGKSFTMILYTNILSHLEALENPTFLILTDRRDLDEQLNSFFRVAGFPFPKPNTAIFEAESILDLREKLSIPAGKIIFTTIQKFQVTDEEKQGMARYPKISERRNIIIIADEAHRSQYKTMAQNLQRALPNALKIGFTGTPIEKEDRSTTHVFGDIISSYKIYDAVRDNATVEISCQRRLVQLHLLNRMIGADFNRITEGLDIDSIEHLSKKWSELKTLLEDPDRIGVIARDIVEHFNSKKKVIKGKAMLAASTKLAAARYADIISSLPNAPKSTCIISGSSPALLDETSIERKQKENIVSKHYKDKKNIEKLISQFKDENNELELLIVCDMFLTGFDAPLVHTMYVDKPLRDHNLIQAISRVNRVWKDKPGGLIVDYIGISDDLKKAFRAYNASDVKRAMVPTEEIVLYMQQKDEELLSFFVSDISTVERLNEDEEDKLLGNAIDEILEDEDVKRKFIQNVTELTKAYVVCTPHPACLEIEPHLRFFQKMRRMMAKCISGIPYAPPDMENAVQELVEEGISADKKIRSYNVTYDDDKIDLNKDYIEKIKKLPQKNLKVELAHKLLDDAIKTKFKRNIVKQKSFQDRIEQSLSKYHSKFEDYETVMQKLEDVAKEVTAEKKREEELELSDEEIAFYDIVSRGKEYINSDKELRQIAINLTKFLKNKVTIDWINQEQVKAEIRIAVRNILRKANLPFEEIDKLIPLIMVQAETNYGQSTSY